LAKFEIVLRLALAILILLKIPFIANTALIIAGLYLAFHHIGMRSFPNLFRAPAAKSLGASDEAT
jgi:hypothetical protein